MKLPPFIRITRPVNCLMMGFAVLASSFVALNYSLPISLMPYVFLGFVTACLLTAAAMVINDYYDREIDALNEPTRVIPSGEMSPESALIYFGILSSLGLIAAYLTNYACFLIALISVLLSYSYAAYLKRTGLVGNLIVSFCVSVPFIYGPLAVSSELSAYFILFALLAFLSNTGREIMKGIADMRGDSLRGIQTVALRYGKHIAAKTSSIFFITAVGISIVPIAMKAVSALYMVFIAISGSGFILVAKSILKNSEPNHAKKLKNIVLVPMFFGILAFLTGLV